MTHIKKIEEFVKEARMAGYRDITPEEQAKLEKQFDEILKEKFTRLYDYAMDYLSKKEYVYESDLDDSMEIYMYMRLNFISNMRYTDKNYTPDEAFDEMVKKIERESKDVRYQTSEDINYGLFFDYMNERPLQGGDKEIVDYAEKYGNEALGYAIRDLIENGEIRLNDKIAGLVWKYDGNTGKA